MFNNLRLAGVNTDNHQDLIDFSNWMSEEGNVVVAITTNTEYLKLFRKRTGDNSMKAIALIHVGEMTMKKLNEDA